MTYKKYRTEKARQEYKGDENNLAYYNSIQREVYSKIVHCLFYDCKDDFYSWLRNHTAMFQWYENEFFAALNERRLFNTSKAVDFVQVNYN